MSRVPEVITGPRSRDERPVAVEHGPGAEQPDKVPAGKVVFKAIAGRYRLQLTAPEEQKRSDGTIKRDKALVAQFDNYMLALDPERKEPGAEKGKEYREKEMIQRLREHPQFRVDFWELDELLAEAREKKRDEVLRVLQDPEDRKAIIDALRAGGYDDFDLPKAKK